MTLTIQIKIYNKISFQYKKITNSDLVLRIEKRLGRMLL